jgi:hypothetical protein
MKDAPIFNLLLDKNYDGFRQIIAFQERIPRLIADIEQIPKSKNLYIQSLFRISFGEMKRLGDIIEMKRGKVITIKQLKEGPYPVIGGGKMPMGQHNEYNRENIYFDKRILFAFTNWEKDIEPHIGTDIFLSLLKKIRFVDKYKNESDMFYNKLTFNKINVVHLRVELDMIYRMDSNNMWAVRERIETSYIDLIKENIQKDDLTIILTYDLNNNVINYLKENGYNYFYTEKKYPEREYNAIIDFLIGERCNNIFIGFPVSTYSYSLEKRMNNVKSIYISI